MTTLEIVNLTLTIAGLMLGIYSAWPRLMRFVSKMKTGLSETARRSVARQELYKSLAISDPIFFLAFICRKLAFSLLLFWLASYSNSLLALTTTPLVKALLWFPHTALLAFASYSLGVVSGFCNSIVRRKLEAVRAA